MVPEIKSGLLHSRQEYYPLYKHFTFCTISLAPMNFEDLIGFVTYFIFFRIQRSTIEVEQVEKSSKSYLKLKVFIDRKEGKIKEEG